MNTSHPHCGTPEPTGNDPHCGEETELVRAASTLDALVSAWAQVAHGQQATVKELAIEFCRTLEGQPELIGVRIRAKWIEDRYPLFCAALGVRSPPFKDFARELAEQMDRERADVRRKGKRESFTTYCVPKATVVALSQEMQQASLALCLDPARPLHYGDRLAAKLTRKNRRDECEPDQCCGHQGHQSSG